MAEQQEKGICFALDEYGSGLASVKYLKDFYFDAAKIDGPLIRGIHADADLQVTAAALISVARHFDMFTVANLVEDRADADMLTQMGVDCLQGYLYGSPSVRPPWEAKPPSRLFG